MTRKNGPAPWATAVRYRDLRRLLTRLGYDCNWIADERIWGNTVRVCIHSSGGPRIVFTDGPLDKFVSPLTLVGVRGELDKFDILSGEEFDRWAKRRGNANLKAAAEANGTATPRKPAGKRSRSQGSRRAQS